MAARRALIAGNWKMNGLAASVEELDAARRAFESDPGVQGLRERFGATLLPDTVRPVK